MVKTGRSVKGAEVEARALEALTALLEKVPVIEPDDVEIVRPGPQRGPDIEIHVELLGRRHTLVCEVKANGQPRHVRTALLQVRDFVSYLGENAIPVLIAPYLSPEAQGLCRENEVGYLDLEGNARLVFGGIFIERQVASRPAVERRELKTLFKPKAAQLLRAMLRDPQRAWRVEQLAEAADVSLGHVSKVRNSLLDREWAELSAEGVFLSNPNALLDAWRVAHELPSGERKGFYTPLHGTGFEDAARRALQEQDGRAAFATFSAANWLAPYGRTNTHYFYADRAGLERLEVALQLSPVSKGENVIVILPKDPGVLRDTVEPAPGAICTSPVQTYLDLGSSGERGQEAATHLRNTILAWPK
jgi:hypothetical protein